MAKSWLESTVPLWFVVAATAIFASLILTVFGFPAEETRPFTLLALGALTSACGAHAVLLRRGK
jgi:hypothetical protein